MIELVEGKGVGAGKSLYVCNRVLALLAKGGTVYASSTFVLNWGECEKYVAKRWGVKIQREQYHTFEFEETFRLHEITPPGTPDNQVLLVIDEAQNVLNAKDHADKSKRPFFAWLTQSRHDDNDVIFITQHSLNIDGQIRRLITFLVSVENMWNVSVPGLGPWPRSPEWLFKRFKVSFYDNSGKVRQDREWYANDPAVFACYESKSCRMAHKRAGLAVAKKQLEKVNETDTPLMKRPLLWFALFCFSFAIWKGWDSYRDFKADQAAKIAKTKDGQKVEKTPVETLGEASGVIPGAPAPVARVAAYTIEKETFRGGDSRTFLHTDAGQYYFGSLSRLGLVTAIRGRVVQIRKPDGLTLYVVAEEDPQIREAKPGPPEPEKPKLPAQVAVTNPDGYLFPWKK